MNCGTTVTRLFKQKCSSRKWMEATRAAAVVLTSAVCLIPVAEGALTHRYTFNTDAAAGGTFEDSAPGGNADGTLSGTATISGGQLMLPGGGTGETGNHASLLANGTDGININTYTNASFSFWATANATPDWGRYFDFGGHSTATPANGGNTIFMTANAGGADGLRMAISNIDLATQSGFNNEQNISVTNEALPGLGVQRHIVGVFNGDTDTMRIYVDGNQVAQNVGGITHVLSLLQTDFAYLGAALYPDPNFNGSFNQFDIYDTALSGSDIVNLYVGGCEGCPTSTIPRLTINRDTGAMSLTNSSSPVQVLGYTIRSAAGALNAGAWQSIADNYDANSGSMQFDNDDEWTELSAADSKTEFSEFTFDNTPGNGGVLGAAFSPQIGGNGAWLRSAVEDVQGEVKLFDGTTLPLLVEYTGNGGESWNRSDLDFDTMVTPIDWGIFYANTYSDLTMLTLAEAARKGDLDGDGDNDYFDYRLFEADYDMFNGAGSFQAMVSAVPEPASIALVLFGALLLVSRRLPIGGRRGLMKKYLMPRWQTASLRVLVRTAAFMMLGFWVTSANADLTHLYTFNNGTANDSVGTADGTLRGRATVAAGVLDLMNPDFTASTDTMAGYLSLPTSILPTSGSATIEQWFSFNPSGFNTQAYTFTDHNNDLGNPETISNPPGAGTGQYLMHTISNPQGGPVIAGGGSSVAQASTGNGVGGDEARAFGTTPGLGVAGGGYLDDGLNLYMAATVIDGTAGTLSYYVFRASDGFGGLQDTIPAIPLSSYSFTNAYLGRSAWPADNFTSGTVDEFRVYNHAMTPDEVAGRLYFGPTNTNPLGIVVNTVTGDVSMVNNDTVAHAIDYYDIDSRDGALLGSWSGMGNRDSTGSGENQSWKKAGGSDAFILSELFLDGQTMLGPGQEIPLGQAYNSSFGDEPDLGIRFRYALANGDLFIGSVTYSDEPSGCSLVGDFSCNGAVENADLTLLLNNWAQPSSPVPAGWIGTPQPTAPSIDNDELTALLNGWGQSVGGGSGSVAGTVPEPTSAALLACGVLIGLGFATSRSRHASRGWLPPNVIARSNMPATILRSIVSTRALLALAISLVVAIPVDAAYLDRSYQFGDDEEETPMADMLPSSNFGVFTLDSAENGGFGFHDLTPSQDGPLYTRTDATTRPGAMAEEWGLRFDGNDFVSRASGGLGSPAIADDDPTYNMAVNYAGITTRLMGGWVRPTVAAGGQRRDVVNDTAQFGIFISGDNQWGFVNGVTAITSTEPVALNAWTHVQHQTIGSTSAVLLVNGIAVAATTSGYNTGAAIGNITFGASTDTTTNFFQGDLDNFDIYVAGQGAEDFGPSNLAVTNDYIRQQLIGIPAGDVDMNGVFDPVADVNTFVTNWGSTKIVNGVAVGDLSTRMKGDFDIDGDLDLDDAYALHLALVSVGAGGLDFGRLGAGVPEPSSFALVVCAAIAASLGRRRREVR